MILQKAILNTFKRRENQGIVEINAVGDSGYSLSKFFEFYTKTLKREFIPIKISLEEFDIIATNFPHGHIAKYTANYLNLKSSYLCNKSFKNLVSEDSKTLLSLTSIS